MKGSVVSVLTVAHASWPRIWVILHQQAMLPTAHASSLLCVLNLFVLYKLKQIAGVASCNSQCSCNSASK